MLQFIRSFLYFFHDHASGCICLNFWNHVSLVLIFWFIVPLNISNMHAQDIEGFGLPWVKYSSTDFRKVADLGVDSKIDIDIGTAEKDYSQIWIGMIKCPTDRKITVTAEADNGLRLFIGDEMIIDGWDEHGARRGTFTAKKNKILPLRLEYFQDGGVAYLRLYWSWKGRLQELIPDSAFSYTKQQRDTVETWAKKLQEGLIPPQRNDHSAIYGVVRSDTLIWNHPQKPITAYPGPHLFIDDYLIESAENVKRHIRQPQRDFSLQNPIVTGTIDRCLVPYFTILPSPETNRYRIWYGAWRDDKSMIRTHLAYMESSDGIHWNRPMILCQTPEIQFGSEVIDRGPDWPNTQERYLYGYWHAGGLRIAVSANGLTWEAMTDRVVLAHNHDINNIWMDPLRKRYIATISTSTRSERWPGRRRMTMQSYSNDLLTWSPPAYVLYANPQKGDDGDTQFYAMSGYLVRGPVLVAMVKILRDDLIAEGVEAGSFGIGYTTLAWSYDGEHWMRDQGMFFEPDPNPSAWDHAHAWIDEQLIVGDSLYLYYGGYKQGHKMNRFSERQIGLVRIPVDRYVAWHPEVGRTGRIRTVPFLVNHLPTKLTVNTDSRAGALKVKVSDAVSGKEIPGLGFSNCRAIRENGLRIPVLWGDEESTRKKLATLGGKTIHLEFQMEGTWLFAFDLK
jgi:hypothetical protein